MSILTTHAEAHAACCQERSCSRPVEVISVHLVTSPSGSQALVMLQQCRQHDAEARERLEKEYQAVPPVWILRPTPSGVPSGSAATGEDK